MQLFRDRRQKGIGTFVTTGADRARRRDFRSEFAPRELAARFFEVFGAVLLLLAIRVAISSFLHPMEWVGVFLLVIAGGGLLCATVVLRRPPVPRPRYWRTAVSGIIGSTCALLQLVCFVIVYYTPKEQIPRWFRGVMGLLVIAGTLAALVCIFSGLRDYITARRANSANVE
jgi:drug/metabolite transporter (DMT)-like permease